MPYTLVTGGSKGLGKEICLSLARTGRDILIHYRSSEKDALLLCEELRSLGVQAEVIQGDFSSLQGTETFLKNCKEIDGLINNVGNYLLGSATSSSPKEFQELFQENVFAPLSLIQGCLPSLKKTKGKIVNIGMVGCGHLTANLHATAYNLTKTSLYQLTLSLAKELAPAGICVNMVSPGYLENSQELPSHLPMGRVADLFEVARAVAFFMDPKSDYITGQNLEVAGGIRL